MSDSPASFHTLNLNVTCYDPDDEPHSSGTIFGGGLVSWIRLEDGVFDQYMAFRNSTYFFFNSTYPHIFYPVVDDEMAIVLSVEFTSVDIFSIRVKTETLFPSVEILSPCPPEGSGILSLNSINRTLTVNASDPSGLQLSRLWGLYEDESTHETDLRLLAANCTPVSGVPHQLRLSLKALIDYAKIANQSMEHLLVDAVLEVGDWTDRAHFTLFEFLFENITTTSVTTCTTTTTTDDWQGQLSVTVVFVLATVAAISLLILRTRRPTEH